MSRARIRYTLLLMNQRSNHTDSSSSFDAPDGSSDVVRSTFARSAGDFNDVRRLWDEFRTWLADRYTGDDRWVIESYFDADAWRRDLDSLPGVFDPSASR